MKKFLLLIFFFIVSFGYSQINTQVSPLVVCDNDSNGIATFNLTTKTSEILGNLNPAINVVSFYETMANAVTGFGALNPNAYTNILAVSQAIFVRVVNTQNGSVSTTQFNLVVKCSTNFKSCNLNILWSRESSHL